MEKCPDCEGPVGVLMNYYICRGQCDGKLLLHTDPDENRKEMRRRGALLQVSHTDEDVVHFVSRTPKV